MKLQSRINKNISILLGAVFITCLGLGGLLILISGNSERDQIPTVPTTLAVAMETTETAEQITQQTVEAGVSKQAQELYDARVASIEDAPAVAKLIDTINIGDRVAPYNPVELQTKEAPKSVLIPFNKKTKIPEAERAAFDIKMQKYAQQILALIEDADQVQWTYVVKKADGSTKKMTVTFDTKQTTPWARDNIKVFGTSAKKIEELLGLQTEPGEGIGV